MGKSLYSPDINDNVCRDCQFFENCKESMIDITTPACEKFVLADYAQEGTVFVLSSEYTNGKKEMNGIFSTREKAENMAKFISKQEFDGIELKSYTIKSWCVL